MNKLVKDALILTVITLIAGLALGAVQMITEDPIKRAEENTQKKAFQALFPDASSFSHYGEFDPDIATALTEETAMANIGSDWPVGAIMITDCNEAKDKNGDTLGLIVTVTNKKSYGGSITLSVGISNENKLTGYMVTDISDTPGLGMKVTEEPFMKKFVDIPAKILSVTKGEANENDIQAISGATISSRAVTFAVDAAIAYVNGLNGGGSNE